MKSIPKRSTASLELANLRRELTMIRRHSENAVNSAMAPMQEISSVRTDLAQQISGLRGDLGRFFLIITGRIDKLEKIIRHEADTANPKDH